MFTDMAKRSYTLKKRADSRDATRERIVAATVELHEKLGPKNTTISAVAERAGVQRLTVYRHFADETALFAACTARWLEDNPPPDPAGWSRLEGIAQVRAGLGDLYAYYRRTERMWIGAHRDEAEVQALRQPMRKFHAYLDGLAGHLTAALNCSGQERDRAALTLRHAVAFATWRSLNAQRLGDDAMVDLVVGWLEGSAAT